MRQGKLLVWILASLGFGLLFAGLFGLREDSAVLRYQFVAEDEFRTPILAFQPRGAENAPGVLLVHGYSGSKEMMQTIARSLARAGMAAYCVDLPGSGASRRLYRRDELPDMLQGICHFLLANGYLHEGKIALVGHSMGGGLVTQLAAKENGIRATVVISSVPVLLQKRPPNLLAVVGEHDLPGLRDETRLLLQETTGGLVSRSGQESGEMATGTACRFVVADGANHLTVLYSRQAVREIQQWLGRSFHLKPQSQPADTMLWLAISYAGVAVLFLPFAVLMGAVRQPREVLSFDPRAGWRHNLICLPSALFAVVVLRYWTPLGFVHIEAGSYLASFFLLAGLARIVLTRLTQTPDPALDLDEVLPNLLTGFAAFLFIYLTFGAVTHRNCIYLLEDSGRLGWFAVTALGISPFFLEDEKVSRSVQEHSSLMGSYFYSLGGKVAVLGVLLLSLVMPFFRAPRFLLTMAFPFLVVAFVVLQFFSAILFHFTRRALSTAVFNILIFAWLLTAPFIRV